MVAIIQGYANGFPSNRNPFRCCGSNSDLDGGEVYTFVSSWISRIIVIVFSIQVPLMNFAIRDRPLNAVSTLYGDGYQCHGKYQEQSGGNSVPSEKRSELVHFKSSRSRYPCREKLSIAFPGRSPIERLHRYLRTIYSTSSDKTCLSVPSLRSISHIPASLLRNTTLLAVTQEG